MSMGSLSDDDMFDNMSDKDISENDSEVDLYDDADGFDIIVSEKDRRKAWEVDFRPHSEADIKKSQDKQIQEICDLLGQNKENSAILLRHFRWDKDRLIEKYMEDSERVNRQAGIIESEEAAPHIRKVTGFMCDICCDDEDVDTYAMLCDHRFCVGCYSQYLTSKIRTEGESQKIQCPGDKCRAAVDERTVRLLVDNSTYDRYITLLNRTYVDGNILLRWCPAPECEYAVECAIGPKQLDHIVPTVVCTCRNRFCFGCGLPDHQPSICRLVKLWIKKCEDDSETANWISAHTKECPKCNSTIEKNGGCNHMTCRKCKNEFCWICMGSWSEHGQNYYNCNRFEEKSGVDARDAQTKSRASLERYLHYYNRFANHEQSAKLDRELYKRTEKKMLQLQTTSDLSWVECQFLSSGVDILCEARQTLKWTYAFAFYLARDNVTELFENNQRDLEMAVEQLSELCEKPIEQADISALKQQILDKTAYVGSRREVLLKDTAAGLQEERWTYIV
ncbi:E3 ubiquitin-protein ligase dbl4 [Neolecta irregularis DAH-3]|uniref:RBR-type E3 ubiquitin transferase n=1 Tax=Neolecta irregularis (strain DAH-3) TaxID=1198029 RepID=A0A1U7LIL7_NEOID|nr:E3 ubiquitin-protein ligase dbl4 [Neolecta irregularis DAH-3]|eukprot:OLL22500.1 E3 ubiquitin-protein ligase dbl4 [Neolecta irregularis DAH-3]